MSDSRDDPTYLDDFAADAQRYGQRITVLDAGGRAVDRGDLTLRWTVHEGIGVDGLRSGDRLYFDGELRYDHTAAMDFRALVSEHVPQVY